MTPKRMKKTLEEAQTDLTDCIGRLEILVGEKSSFGEYTKNKLRKIKTDVQDELRSLNNLFQYELKLGGEDRDAY